MDAPTTRGDSRRATEGTPAPARPVRLERAWLLVLLLGLALQLPGLGIGFFADDHLHQLALDDRTGLVPTPRWNLYDFGQRSDWEAFAEARGSFPWWTDADWKARFLRPLPSLLLGLEHALFGHWAPGYHLTSLGLWLCLLVLARGLYRRLGLSPRATLAGLLILACSDASSLPVGWIANRNSLLEGLFATGALACVLGRGRGPGRRATAAALVLACAAALSKESGAVTLLLVALVLRSRGRVAPGGEGRRLTRAAGLATALLLAYALVIGLGGYGTRSGYYATPWLDPLRSLFHLALLASAGALSVLGPFSLDAVFAFPAQRLALVLVAGTLGALVGWPLVRWVARTVGGRPRMGWMGLWAALALVPQCGVLPGDRLLFVPTIGLAAILGTFWDVQRARWPRLGRPTRTLVLGLAVSVVGLSGLFLVTQNQGLAGIASYLRRTALATDVGPAGSGARQVVVLQTESQMAGFTLAGTWSGEGGAEDVRFHLLQSGARPLRWSRPAERVFEFETLGEPFLGHPFESVYRSGNDPPAVGTRWSTPLFTVEALAVDGAGLRRVRLEFLHWPSDPPLRFVRSVDGVLTRVEPPAVGASVELPRPQRAGPFVP